jgi:hypothetical protein
MNNLEKVLEKNNPQNCNWTISQVMQKVIVLQEFLLP